MNFQRAARAPPESQTLAFVQQDAITAPTYAADGRLGTVSSENQDFSLDVLDSRRFGEP